jgi:hypothetical protein
MAGKPRGWVWVKSPPKKPTFDKSEKERIIAKTKTLIERLDKLQRNISRIDFKGNRLYLYCLFLQHNPRQEDYIMPLIDGKYLEYPYARIDFNKADFSDCTVFWQRHNGLWMDMYSGNLDKCLTDMEKDTIFFLDEKESDKTRF